jgi:hypothetical protein
MNLPASHTPPEPDFTRHQGPDRFRDFGGSQAHLDLRNARLAFWMTSQMSQNEYSLYKSTGRLGWGLNIVFLEKTLPRTMSSSVEGTRWDRADDSSRTATPGSDKTSSPHTQFFGLLLAAVEVLGVFHVPHRGVSIYLCLFP